MVEIDITYDIENIEEYFDEEKIKEFVDNILKGEKENYTEKDFYVSLMITNNEVIHKINREYRGKDRPTDVISFAYNETENIGPVEIIGDIIISIDKVKEQALEFGHSNKREFYYLLTHGMLHILGYDHIIENEQKAMRLKEEKYLNDFGIKRI